MPNFITSLSYIRIGTYLLFSVHLLQNTITNYVSLSCHVSTFILLVGRSHSADSVKNAIFCTSIQLTVIKVYNGASKASFQ